ncbi:MAG: ABC transporter permease [Candidatus Binatus sp.]|uniref:ABC transporter permease n=1 Tax=Candidatus Binatus sp. TaxID=2811406 RepID=UPI002726B154|nr:ABC transporter permease [Candidatus Binatus sp.]MDO8431898.1 ABC transporter permease [Candidatus Binatus sp.]
MNFHRMLAVSRKEVLQVVRDRRSLLIVLVMPLMLMTLLGYGVNLDTKHIRVYALDREGSPASQDLLKRFQSSEYFKLVAMVTDYRALHAALDDGRCQLAIVIPHDFSARLHDGRPVKVQALVDGSDANTAQIAIAYAQGVLAGYGAAIQAAFFRRSNAPAVNPSISIETRTWFNEDLESKNFIVPGVAAIVMAVVGTLLTSLTIAREWERGTMEQLISTPVTALELILGKLIPYFALGMFDTAICVSVAVWWFEVPFRGSIVTLAVGSGLFMTVILGLGFWISVITRDQLAASQIGLVAAFLPSMLLSGFTFPIDQMAVGIRPVTYIVAARYYIIILKGVFLRGNGLRVLAVPALALSLYTVLMVLLAKRSFHKSLV